MKGKDIPFVGSKPVTTPILIIAWRQTKSNEPIANKYSYNLGACRNFQETNTKRNRKQKVLIGSFLITISIILFISFISFFYNWQEDYSTLYKITDRDTSSSNILNKLGAYISHLFIYKLFGLGSFILVYLIFKTGFILFFSRTLKNVLKNWTWGFFHIIWLSIALGFFYRVNPLLGGIVGYELNSIIVDFIGDIVLIIILSFFFLCFLVEKLQ